MRLQCWRFRIDFALRDVIERRTVCHTHLLGGREKSSCGMALSVAGGGFLILLSEPTHLHGAAEDADHFDDGHPGEISGDGRDIVGAQEFGDGRRQIGREVAVAGDTEHRRRKAEKQRHRPPEIAEARSGEFGAGVERGEGIKAGDADHPRNDPSVRRVFGAMRQEPENRGSPKPEDCRERQTENDHCD